MPDFADIPITERIPEERTPLPDAAVAALRQYAAHTRALEAESMAYLRGLVIGLGLDPDAVTGVELGEDPALVFAGPEAQPPTDASTDQSNASSSTSENVSSPRSPTSTE